MLLGSNPPITIDMDNGVSYRLYEDSRPHHLEISTLQKGLVLLVDNKEVIEEGAGFGAPVVMYRDRPFFSGSAETSVQAEENGNTLFKSFAIDTVSQKRFRKRFYLNQHLYCFIQKRFHNIYTRNKSVAPVFTVVIELLKKVGVETEFQKTKSVNFKYSCFPNSIEVEVALSNLEMDGRIEVLILNEQGASFFISTQMGWLSSTTRLKRGNQ